MRIEYLADHQELIPEVARLHFAEWGHLHPDETLEQRTESVRSCSGRGGVPSTFVGLCGSALCGSAMLVAHDMDTHSELTPWLAGVYVREEFRHKGYGSALVDRVVSEAASLGIPELYLYTASAHDLYAGLGWSLLERDEYLGQEVLLMSLKTAAEPGLGATARRRDP